MIKRILVVDDKSEQRRFIGDVLRSDGYEVIEAGSIKHAAEILLHEQPLHLLVLDQMISGTTGTSFWKRIKSEIAFQSVKDIPIIFLTAYPDDEEIMRLEKNIPVLSKPLRDYRDLLEAVRTTLKHKDA